MSDQGEKRSQVPRSEYEYMPDPLRVSFRDRFETILNWAESRDQSWLNTFVNDRLLTGGPQDPRVALVASMAEAKQRGAGDGVILVSGSGAILFADQTARALLVRRVWLEDRDGVLTGVLPAFDRELTGLLEETLKPGVHESCLRLDAKDTTEPLFLRATVFQPLETGGDTAPFVIVHLRPEVAPLDLDQRCLVTWYAMTETEAKLAVAFAKGQSLADYAKANAVSINTVRTLFARLKAKLDAPDQAAVVRKVIVAALRR